MRVYKTLFMARLSNHEQGRPAGLGHQETCRSSTGPDEREKGNGLELAIRRVNTCGILLFSGAPNVKMGCNP
jgi:hypothetical protein